MTPMSLPFQVASAVAGLIASSEDVAEAAGVAPRVYLHAVDPDEPGDPVVLVSAGRETLPVRGDRSFQVAVVIGCRPADSAAGNPDAAAPRPDGVLVPGSDPARIDRIAAAVSFAVCEADDLGAILAGAECETDVLDPASHIATLTFDFTEISTF